MKWRASVLKSNLFRDPLLKLLLFLSVVGLELDILDFVRRLLAHVVDEVLVQLCGAVVTIAVAVRTVSIEVSMI